MKMLRANLLVKLLPKENPSKIALPESFKEEWYRGEVMLVGKEVEEVKVGDIAKFPPPFRGDWPRLDYRGEECIILPESDIWAVE